jgi:hypothetical protein
MSVKFVVWEMSLSLKQLQKEFCKNSLVPAVLILPSFVFKEMSLSLEQLKRDFPKHSLLATLECSGNRRKATLYPTLKGHGNEADFLGILHKPVWHRSITLRFKPFRFWLPIHGDIHNR